MTDNSTFLAERQLLLTELSTAYYNGTPKVQDAEFDQLLEEYYAAGGEEMVGHGYKVENSRKVTHVTQMGSLKKVKEDQSLLVAWMNSCHDFWKENCDTTVPLTFNVSPKFDGLAVVVTVENGKVVMAATRGDGFVGENVTDTALHVPEIDALSKDGIYNGEILLPKENLDEANKWRDAKDEKLSQIRNAAAGIIRREAKSKAGESAEKFAVRQERVSKSAELLIFANHNAGGYVQLFTYEETLAKLDETLASFEPIRTNYPVAPGKHVFIDGVVFKVENADVREGMGWSSGCPRWARAFKFADLAYESRITGVDWGVPGKIGRITPVIEYETIHIDGGKYNRATAHNLTQFNAFAPHIGDKISVVKSGDVIPYVVSIEHSGDGVALEIPSACPMCGADTAVVGEFLVCTNNRISCDPVKALTLIINGLGIKGVQEAIIKPIYDTHLSVYSDMHDALAAMKALPEGVIGETTYTYMGKVSVKDENGKVKKDADGNAIKEEGLVTRTIGKPMEKKIKDALNDAWENAPLANWIYGLNVDRVGSTVSRTLEATYGSLEAVLGAIDDPAKYREVEHLKGVNWNAIKEGRAKFETLKNWIENNGIKAPVATVTVVQDDFWGGKKVALTGTLPVTRPEAEAWLKEHGATISGSFDILIDAGDGSSSKSQKARQKNKQVMLGDEFMSDHYNRGS